MWNADQPPDLSESGNCFTDHQLTDASALKWTLYADPCKLEAGKMLSASETKIVPFKKVDSLSYASQRIEPNGLVVAR